MTGGNNETKTPQEIFEIQLDKLQDIYDTFASRYFSVDPTATLIASAIRYGVEIPSRDAVFRDGGAVKERAVVPGPLELLGVLNDSLGQHGSDMSKVAKENLIDFCYHVNNIISAMSEQGVVQIQGYGGPSPQRSIGKG